VLEEREVLAPSEVLHDAVADVARVPSQQAIECRERILPVVHDMPEDEANIAFGGELHDPALAHPGRHEAIALRGEIDEHAPRLFGGQREDLVGAFVLAKVDRPRVLGVEAEQRPMGGVGVDAYEREGAVDAILSAQARYDGFAYTAFLSSDEVDRAHDDTLYAFYFG
jgi:hypothetical protein